MSEHQKTLSGDDLYMLVQYMEHAVSSDVVTDFERTFAASIIKQYRTRRGFSPSQKQIPIMWRIKDKVMELMRQEQDEYEKHELVE